MPRRARLNLTGQPLHIVQRGNNRAGCFFADEDYLFYLHWLAIYAKQYGCAVHAFVLMTNHVHLLLTLSKRDAPAKLMQSLGRRYVQYVNKVYKRSRTLWEGRYKASLVNAEQYLLACHRYIEMNPVRANMVEHPRDYVWSSYVTNAEGKANPLITSHELVERLGVTEVLRREAYVGLFRTDLDAEVMSAIRTAANTGRVLGDDRFRDEIAVMTGKRVSPGSWGRKRKDVNGAVEGEQVGFGF